MKRLFLLIALLCASPLLAQDFNSSYNFVAKGTQGPGTSFANSNVTAFAISWSAAPPLQSCAVQVDSSADGITWGSGDLIASQSCLPTVHGPSIPDGSVAATALAAGKNFVRINVTVFNGQGGLNVTLKGYGGAGGSSSSSPGPVINVTNPTYTGCPAAANADWVTCFTSASAALDAASLVGTPTVRASLTDVATCHPCTSFPITFSTQVGDTVLIWLSGAATSDTVSITDNSAGGSALYRVISPVVAGSTTTTGLWGTVPRGAGAATTITITDNVSRNLYVVVAAVSNYGAEKSIIPFTSASTSAPSILNASTLDTNNLWLVGFQWFLGATTVTASANSGTVVQNQPSSATALGLGLVSNAVSAQFAASTDSLTLSNASTAQAIGVEIRSHSEVMPTLYIPQGEYRYSGGLSLLHPATLKGEPGSRLCYTGNAHAVDIGPAGMTANAFMRTFFVDGLEFACGSNMTAGLYANTYANFVGVRNSNFLNFGNSTAYMIQGVNNNQDMEIGPQNKFIVDDGLPRNIFINETANATNASYARIHDNLIVCWNLQALVPTQCSTAQAGVGFSLNGAQSRVYHNNLAFFNPDILFRCNPGPCFGNEAAYNQMEPPTSGTTPGAPIQFGTGGVSNGQIGLLIHENVINQGVFSAVSLVGPQDGTSVLVGARINFNTGINIAAATPTVVLNNIAGQVGNQSSNNLCGTGATTLSPCPIAHTTGASITTWSSNSDDNMTATGQAPALTGTGACATITTQKGSWAGQATCTGTTGASTFIITPGFTATNGFQCDASDLTTAANALRQSATSATACTIAGTVNANDVLTFKVVAY